MDVIIRQVKKEEIPATIDIKITGWQNAYRGIIDDEYLDITLPSSREERIKDWKQNYKDGNFIVAKVSDEVVAFSRFVDNNSFSPNIDCDCELMAIYVKPKYKHNGIGTKLFEYIKNYFTQQNKKKMVLWCLKDNNASIKFYKKMGGKEIGEKEAKIGNKKYKEIAFIFNINKEDL